MYLHIGKTGALVTGFMLMAFAAFTQLPDTLYWTQNNRIAWSDFRGNPNPKSTNGASTASGIIYSYQWLNGKVAANADAYFLRSRSWKKVNQDLQILKHEQYHFHINRYHALRLKIALENLSTTRGYLHYSVQLVVDRIFGEKNEMQAQYDKETRHGSKLKQQQDWEKYVDGLLKAIQP